VKGAGKRRARLETSSTTTSQRVRSVGGQRPPHRVERRGNPRNGVGALGRAGRTRQRSELRRQASLWGCASGASTPRVRRASPLSCESRWSAAPATKQGVREAQLDPGSNSGRPHTFTGGWMTTLRARYRSHSSFVDRRDEHLDEIPRQGVADNLTPTAVARSTAVRKQRVRWQGCRGGARAPTGFGVFGRRVR
jgi:hypothetical protein